MSILKHSMVFLLVVCLACSAQQPSASELDHRIERHVRAKFNLPPNVEVVVGSREKSDFANYEKITLTFVQRDHKQDFEFLLSKDGKELIRLNRMDLTKDPYAVVMEKIDISSRPYRGNKDAKVVIVNYDDFQCPYCSRMHHTLTEQVLKSYSDKVKLVYKDFPLYEIHPWANRAAVDSNCLGAQSNEAYWGFVDYVHLNGREISGERGQKSLDQQLASVDAVAVEQGKKFNLNEASLSACIKAQKDDMVRASVEEAVGLGVQATPTLFINGEKIDGAVPYEQLKAVIDRALRDAGEQAPASATVQ